jgi:DNA uptake protein ComE-like DNA-binding protein
MNRTLLRCASAGLVTAALTLTSCSSGSDVSAGSSTTTTAKASATTLAAGSSTTAAPTTMATAKVNANTATVDELTAALQAAGVPSAARWAHEVEEYRPYTSDNWAHLRTELAKYNIDADTLNKILSALTL